MPRVRLPVCEWCGSIDAFKCRMCDHYSCWDCTIHTRESCRHKKFEVEQSNPDWATNNIEGAK